MTIPSFRNIVLVIIHTLQWIVIIGVIVFLYFLNERVKLKPDLQPIYVNTGDYSYIRILPNEGMDIIRGEDIP